MPDRLDPSTYRRLVREALAEDVGPGDVTTAATVPADVRMAAAIVAKMPCVIAGLDVAREVFATVDPAIVFEDLRSDGSLCRPGDRVAAVTGPAAGILTAERTALNILQHLSGIATRTREFVEAAGGRIKILDTRKTIPGLRALAKYAVRLRRRLEPSRGPLRRHLDQGQSHRGGRRRDGSRPPRPCDRIASADRDRGGHARRGGCRGGGWRRHRDARQHG